jgi:hypothetical protein
MAYVWMRTTCQMGWSQAAWLAHEALTSKFLIWM